MIDVLRSPARVAWHVVFWDKDKPIMLACLSTKKEAIAQADRLATDYGVKLSTKVLNHVL